MLGLYTKLSRYPSMEVLVRQPCVYVCVKGGGDRLFVCCCCFFVCLFVCWWGFFLGGWGGGGGGIYLRLY